MHSLSRGVHSVGRRRMERERGASYLSGLPRASFPPWDTLSQRDVLLSACRRQRLSAVQFSESAMGAIRSEGMGFFRQPTHEGKVLRIRESQARLCGLSSPLHESTVGAGVPRPLPPCGEGGDIRLPGNAFVGHTLAVGDAGGFSQGRAKALPFPFRPAQAESSSHRRVSGDTQK